MRNSRFLLGVAFAGLSIGFCLGMEKNIDDEKLWEDFNNSGGMEGIEKFILNNSFEWENLCDERDKEIEELKKLLNSSTKEHKSDTSKFEQRIKKLINERNALIILLNKLKEELPKRIENYKKKLKKK